MTTSRGLLELFDELYSLVAEGSEVNKLYSDELKLLADEYVRNADPVKINQFIQTKLLATRSPEFVKSFFYQLKELTILEKLFPGLPMQEAEIADVDSEEKVEANNQNELQSTNNYEHFESIIDFVVLRTNASLRSLYDQMCNLIDPNDIVKTVVCNPLFAEVFPRVGEQARLDRPDLAAYLPVLDLPEEEAVVESKEMPVEPAYSDQQALTYMQQEFTPEQIMYFQIQQLQMQLMHERGVMQQWLASAAQQQQPQQEPPVSPPAPQVAPVVPVVDLNPSVSPKLRVIPAIQETSVPSVQLNATPNNEKKEAAKSGVKKAWGQSGVSARAANSTFKPNESVKAVSVAQKSKEKAKPGITYEKPRFK